MGNFNLSVRRIEPRLTRLGYYITRSTSSQWLQDDNGRTYRWLIGAGNMAPHVGCHSLADVLVFIDHKEIDEEYRRSET